MTGFNTAPAGILGELARGLARRAVRPVPAALTLMALLTLPWLAGPLPASAQALQPGHGPAITASTGMQQRVLGRPPSQAQAAAVETEVTRLVGLMTLDEKIALIGGTGAWDIKPLARLGLPRIYGTDGGAGVRLSTPVGVNYPAATMVAATWSAERARDVGVAMARDTKNGGFHNLLAPGMNMNRIAYGGRSAEYGSGEDPYLGAVMMPAMINGIQSQGVWATAKHIGVNDAETNRFAIDVRVDERTLREIYLLPFESSVKSSRPANIMCAFNRINGEYACESRKLLTDIVKRDWGYDGFIESDYNAVINGELGALAGTDIDMPTGAQMNAGVLLPAVLAGRVSESLLDDKVRRIVRQTLRFGFETGTVAPGIAGPAVRDEQSERVALEAAREGIVLLTNRNRSLPLSNNRPQRIAVIGQRAIGDPPKAYGSTYFQSVRHVAIVEGLRAVAPAGSTVDLIDSMTLDPARTRSVAGFQGRYYTAAAIAGPPALTRVDTVIDIDWSAVPATSGRAVPLSAAPQPTPASTYFAAEWSGQILPLVTGDHVFKVRADGAVRVWVNGVEVINNGEGLPVVRLIPNTIPVFGKARLTAGVVADVVVQYVRKPGYISNLGAFSGVQFSWASLQAPAALAGYDAVIVAAGLGHEYEGEGFDRPFAMPEYQSEMIASVAAVNPRTVALVAAGGAVDMRAFSAEVGALLYVWYPGQNGGRAIADAVFGAVNPSGKLPITLDARIEDNPAFPGFPVLNDFSASTLVYGEGLFMGYRGYDKSGRTPLFAFGHGLSYTTFAYADMAVASTPMSCSVASAVAPSTADARWAAALPLALLAGFGWRRGGRRTRRGLLAVLLGGTLLAGCFGGSDDDDDNGGSIVTVAANRMVQVSFMLTNTGSVAGSEVAQVYVTPLSPRVERPSKELKGFAKVALAAGESKRVTVTLNPRAFAYYDVSKAAWVIDEGRYRVRVGGASDSLPVSTELRHDAELLSVKASVPTTLAPEGGAAPGLCFE